MSRIIIPGARTASPARRPVLPDGLLGRASLWFDGVDDRVTGTNPLSAASAFTFLAWLQRLRLYTNHECLFECGTHNLSCIQLLLDLTNRKLRAISWVGGVNVQDVNCPGPVAVGEWLRVGFRRGAGSSTVDVFINGGNIASSVATAAPNIVGASCYLGKDSTSWPSMCRLSDARLYQRKLADGELAADARGEPVSSTGLVRRWSCENPGFGTTCREEVGGTNDAITGALWSPVVPFRRRRIVEDVPAGALATAALTLNVSDHADLNPGTASYSFSQWVDWQKGTTQKSIAGKMEIATYPNVRGWMLIRQSTGVFWFYQSDGSGAVWDGASVAAGAIPDGHCLISAVRNAELNKLFLYVNAQLRGEATILQGGTINNTVDLSLVRTSYAAGMPSCRNDSYWLKGTAWSPGQIEAHYFDGAEPLYTVKWPLRDGSGTTAISQPAGYNGTLSAASWTTKTRCPALRSVA